MSDHDRFIGQLEDYLEAYDGDPPLPIHVRDAIRAALPATRQVRPARGPWRLLTMFTGLSTPARGGLVAAVLVGAVVLGVIMLPTVGGAGGDEPSAAPSVPASIAPSVAPTSAPSASPAPSDAAAPDGPVPIGLASAEPCYEDGPASGCIAPGTYALNPETIPGAISLEVPAGWFSWEPGAGAMSLLVDGGPDAPDGSGWGPMFGGVDEIRRDPCATDGAIFAATEIDTPARIAAAMATWPGFTVSEPSEITLGGAPGVQVDVAFEGDLGACLISATWSTPLGTWLDAYPMIGENGRSEPATFRILDLDDGLLVIRTPASTGPSSHEIAQGVAQDPERHAEHMTEMEAMLESVRFVEEGAS